MITTQTAYETVLLALCCWREARGETLEAQRGVIWSVLNRAARPGWWGKDVVSVILMPKQYSSFNADDPNAVKLPTSTDSVWQEIMLLAVSPGADPTGGATNYYSDGIPSPSWAAEMTLTKKIDSLNFYR